MPFSRAPAWRYFPPTDPAPPPLAALAGAMKLLSDWLEHNFWPGTVGTSIATVKITEQLEAHLAPESPPVILQDGLRSGWNLETREGSLRIPLLYGEDGTDDYGVQPDLIHASPDGSRTLVEIEGGGALNNNRVMKDLVETLLIPSAHQLAVVVPHAIHGRSPYNTTINLVTALYARQVPQPHVLGVMVIGY